MCTGSRDEKPSLESDSHPAKGGDTPSRSTAGGNTQGANPKSKTKVKVPAMPTVKTPFPHRTKDQFWPLYNAMVAKILTPKEARACPQAVESLRKEFESQRSKGVWDESRVREWSEVAAEAKKSGKTAHVGTIFGIAAIKNYELPDGHKDNKYK